MARTMAAEAYSSVEKIKKLESELADLKESNTSAPTSLQLEAARQEIMDLKTRLDAIQIKYENAEKEIERYIPQIQDLERSISEFCSAAYAKDEELIATYNQAIHFKKVVDRLEPQVSELQGVLKTNDNLKKEIEELQRVRACLLEENEQLKSENDGFKASLIQNQADFYKLGYVDHLYGRPSDFEFFVEGVDTQAGAVEGKDSEDAAAENTKAAEGVTT
nr:tropomyosin-like [Malus domestica]